MPRLAAVALIVVAAVGASASDAEEGSCPVEGGCRARTHSQGEYLWPHGRGQPRHFGQSPYSFGGRECNLSASLKWSWTHPAGKYHHVIVGKPIVDDKVNIYIATENTMRKFSPDGQLLWTWQAPVGAAIPNNAAIMDGNVYNCLVSGEVFALSMETGELVWMVKVSARGIGGDTAFTIARDGRVILDVDAQAPPAVNNRVVALNGSSGELLWSFSPDTGVWNFLPLFPGDGTIVFQSWSGSAYRVNLTDGQPLWRAGAPPGGEAWTDGGAALGPNGVFYTVSSSGKQSDSFKSWGGGLHAFSVSDGAQLWRRTDFDRGIYTYPVVGRLNSGPGLSVVTGEGSLGSPGLIPAVAMVGPPLAGLGLLVGFLAGAVLPRCCCRKRCGRCRRGGCLRRLCLLALTAVLCAAGAVALLAALAWRWLPSEYLTSVHAFDAETGETQWKVDLPLWRARASAGDEEGFLGRTMRGTRALCLPLASSYATLDAHGAFYMGHHDGRLYRIKDWNGDGRIEGASELCSFHAGSAFFTGGPTVVPGMLLATTCDTLYVFQEQ